MDTADLINFAIYYILIVGFMSWHLINEDSGKNALYRKGFEYYAYKSHLKNALKKTNKQIESDQILAKLKSEYERASYPTPKAKIFEAVGLSLFVCFPLALLLVVLESLIVWAVF